MLRVLIRMTRKIEGMTKEPRSDAEIGDGDRISTLGFCIVGADERVETSNWRFRELLDIPRDVEVIGSSIKILLQTYAEALDANKFLAAGSRSETVEVEPSGSLRLSLIGLGDERRMLTIEPPATSKQELIGLRRSERRLRDFLSISTDWFWEMNAQTEVTFLSSSFQRATGMTIDSFLGFGWRESRLINFLHEAGYENFMNALQAREEVRDVSLVREFDDGARRYFALKGSPVFDKDGAFLGYRGTGQEITPYIVQQEELTKTRMEAEAANLAKSHFLSAMSHELRTPLNSILGFGQLLDVAYGDNGEDSDQKTAIHQILSSGQHLLGLVNQILDFARIETGHIQIAQKDVRVLDALQESINMASAAANEAGLKMTLAVTCPETVSVRVDPTRLRQIVLNLLSNATKYNRLNGSIEIHCDLKESGRVRISVVDTGRGITAENHSDVFLPFNRLGQDAGEIEGTGIGLTISKALIELMGGAIDYESVPGSGTTFWIELPVSAEIAIDETALETGAEEHQRDTMAGPAEPAVILYIEDNPANLLLMKQTLSRVPNTHMISALNAEDGIASAKEYVPDLILMDINLPGMNGLEAIKWLKEGEVTATIPIIAISASAMTGDIKRGYQAGAVRYITKPINVTEAIDVVREILDQR